MAASDEHLRIHTMQALDYVADKEAILWSDYDRKKALEAMSATDDKGEAHDLQGDASVNYDTDMSKEPKNAHDITSQGDAQSPLFVFLLSAMLFCLCFVRFPLQGYL